MENSNPCRTSTEQNLKIDIREDKQLTKKPFRQLLGCLNFVANLTRPDICFAG